MSTSSKTFEIPQASTSQEKMSEEEKAKMIDAKLNMQEEYALDYESMKGEAEYVSQKQVSREALDRIQARKIYKRRGGILAHIAELM